MKQRILIVDDEPNIVMSLEYTFKKKEYEVFIARNGKEAIDIIDKKELSIVILDIMMPEVDGYQVLEHIKTKENTTSLKVIFLSAKNKEEDIKKGIQAGVDRYITKPFSVKEVVNEVEKLITS